MRFRLKFSSPSGLETEGGGLQRFNGTGPLGIENWSVDEGEVKTFPAVPKEYHKEENGVYTLQVKILLMKTWRKMNLK